MKHGSLIRGQLWLMAFILFLSHPYAEALTITEIMYHPPDGGPNLQYVEIFNDAGTVADLSNWYFSNGIDFTFPEGTFLEGRSYLVVCADTSAVQARYFITNIIGDFSGNLENHGETIEIADNSGVRQVLVSYKDWGKWPAAPGGTGHSLSLKGPFLDPEDSANWAHSIEIGGTPGRPNFPPSANYVEETVLIDKGESWKYLKGTAEFSNPVSAWRSVGFADSGWTSAPTGIGYGEGYLTTNFVDVVWSMAARKTFTLTTQQIAQIENLVLAISYDDGFVAYINGHEVTRSSTMPGAPGTNVAWNTAATAHESNNTEEQFPIPKTDLVVGTNVLAIQVNNLSLGSSDLVMIPRLVSQRIVIPPSGGPLLCINEVFGRTSAERWIEIYNSGPDPVELGGYHISDDALQLGKGTLPAGPIAGRGFKVFTEAQAGVDLSAPEVKLFLSLPDLARVLDACVLANAPPPDRTDISDARFPDGSSQWDFAQTPTQGAANRIDVETGIVINEIMYDPFKSRMTNGGLVDERPGKYLELYNRSDRTIPLTGWAFKKGIEFFFPDGISMTPGQYLVIAENPQYIQDTYGLTGVLGPWLKNLSGKGDTVRLEDPIGNTVDEVEFATGGDWPEHANGRGSSLELIDPLQDNSAGSAWADSDETGKAGWTELTYTGSFSPTGDSVLRFTPLEEGSFLLDDVRVILGSTNYIPNPGFEANTSPWVIQGTLVHSRRTTADKKVGSACLEVIATGAGDLRNNRLAVQTSPSMPGGTYNVKLWARWLYGGNLLLVHGFDNAMARPLWMPVPRNLGTPGEENSATAALRLAGGVNLGPVISNVEQNPVSPNAAEAVTVSARISDADGVASAAIRWRLNTRSGAYGTIAMADNGQAPDRQAGDGIWTGSIPAQAQGSRVVFYIEATDATGPPGAKRTYPVNAAEKTLLYRVGGIFNAPLPVYRLSMDSDTQGELDSRPLHSDDPLYGSMVFDDSEIHYNVGLHYHGSPWNRPGSPRMFNLTFPADRTFHGVKKFKISRYGSALNEATAYYTISRTGRPDSPSPASDYRFIRWELNGSDQGNMSHVETIDATYGARRFGSDGFLYKGTGKITFLLDDNWGLSSWTTLNWRGADKEAYRWNFILQSRELEDDWTALLAWLKIMDAGQTPDSLVFDEKVRGILDVEQFLRVEALRVMNDDWDGVGIGNGQNTFFYYSLLDGRWKLVPWDMDHTYANTAATTFPNADPGTTRLANRPGFRRIYLRSIRDSLQKTWNVPRLSKFLDPIAVKGIGNSDGIKNFVAGRTPTLNSVVGADVTFKVTTTSGSDLVSKDNPATIKGDAPLDLESLVLNGELIDPQAITWSTGTAWQIRIPNPPDQTQKLDFFGFDPVGNIIGSASINLVSAVSWKSPTISSISPSTGTTLGGTAVTITGTDFHPGVRVRFLSTYVPTLIFVASEELRVTTPARSIEGAVTVTVMNLDTRIGSKTNGYTYSMLPIVDFLRGDANLDKEMALSDAIAILDFLYRNGSLGCLDAADANDDGSVDLTDAVRILLSLYAGMGPLPLPSPDIGTDPTTDSLDCATY